MTDLKEIYTFYSSCRAPTEMEKLQKKLGMCDKEFDLYLKFKQGKSDMWLVLG